MKFRAYRKFLFAALLSLAAGAHADSLSDAKVGMAALDGGDYSKAITLFTRAITKGGLGPEDLELAYVKRAEAYVKQNNNRLALRDLEQAAALKPDDVDIASLREAAGGKQSSSAQEESLNARAGLMALSAGDYSGAVSLLTRAIDDGNLSLDDQELAYLKRGQAYVGLNQSELALVDLAKARSLKPDDPDINPLWNEAEEETRQDKAPNQLAVYFAPNTSEVTPADLKSLNAQAARLSENQAVRVTIQGNVFTQTTREYALALGALRANIVKKVLMDHGISEDRISVVSYGKELPRCTDRDDACSLANNSVVIIEDY